MTTKQVLTLLVLVMAVSVAVARSRQRADDAPGTRSFAVTGVVTAPAADGRVMVSHDDIPGFMPAMTMPFTLRPADPLPVLTVGDRVRFTLKVGDEATWAEGFAIIGRDAAVASAVSGPATTATARIKKGDRLPEVALLTQAGSPFGTRAFEGHVTAVTFIFTRCPMPEFCPLMVKRFQQLQRAIAADRGLGQGRLLAVTLDPTFDTPQVLHAYATAMQADPARWTFVTGPTAEVTRLTRAFAVHVERNGVLLDHTLATAVVGPDGRLFEIWRGNGWKADEVLDVMRAAAATTE